MHLIEPQNIFLSPSDPGLSWTEIQLPNYLDQLGLSGAYEAMLIHSSGDGLLDLAVLNHCTDLTDQLLWQTDYMIEPLLLYSQETLEARLEIAAVDLLSNLPSLPDTNKSSRTIRINTDQVSQPVTMHNAKEFLVKAGALIQAKHPAKIHVAGDRSQPLSMILIWMIAKSLNISCGYKHYGK
ncbi:MAG: hypothetical protein AAFQ87_02640 [Bacteroidota bacterium]